MIPAMKITAIEMFVVNTGFKPARPWHFCAIRTDEGLTGYSEFGSEGLTRGLVGLVQDLSARLITSVGGMTCRSIASRRS
jgi:L-alanine-DL-glutamate epimerase-like enolase superfamily enzyme